MGEKFRKVGERQLLSTRAKCGGAAVLFGTPLMVSGVMEMMQANALYAQADAMPSLLPTPGYNALQPTNSINAPQMTNVTPQQLHAHADSVSSLGWGLIIAASVIVLCLAACYIMSDRGKPNLEAAQAIDKYTGSKGESIDLTAPGQWKKDEEEDGGSERAHM